MKMRAHSEKNQYLLITPTKVGLSTFTIGVLNETSGKHAVGVPGWVLQVVKSAVSQYNITMQSLCATVCIMTILKVSMTNFLE